LIQALYRDRGRPARKRDRFTRLPFQKPVYTCSAFGAGCGRDARGSSEELECSPTMRIALAVYKITGAQAMNLE